MATRIESARRRLRTANLYLVTPREPRAGPLDRFLTAVLSEGVDIVQLREKSIPAAPLLRCCEVIRARTEEFGALFIVNDRVDVALAAGADGVHLGQDDLTLDQGRALAPGLLIGLSTHSEEQITAARGADYIGVGPLYETPTKPGKPPVGPGLVSFAARSAGVPFFAIGGVDLTNTAEVRAAGATRISVLRAITEADDPAAAARAFKQAMAGG